MSSLPVVVLKFGGTSVATPQGWRTIRDRIALCIEQQTIPLAVHSALAGVSSRLENTLAAAVDGSHKALLVANREQHLALADGLQLDGDRILQEHFGLLERLTAGIALLGEASPRQHARVVSLGERMASHIGHAWLQKQGINIELLDARDLLTSVDDDRSDPDRRYLNAECDFAPDPAARAALASGADAYLTQGFIARDTGGDTVLLGRGGSDTTASYLAAKIGAQRIEIWTDVAGMYSADPRLVPAARLLKRLDYSEAQEVASTGARVLHPRCLTPASACDIPLHVKSTAEPDADGTLVSREPGSTQPRLKAISARKDLTLVSMETSGMWQESGFLARAFAVFARRQISIDLISSSATSVTVSLDATPQQLAGPALRRTVTELEQFCRVQVLDRCAAISLVGRQVRAILHEVAPAFEVFKEHEIHLVSQAANDLNFTFVVDEKHCDRLVQRLHELLIRRGHDDAVMGRSWAESSAQSEPPGAADPPWWDARRDELLALAPDNAPLFVYSREVLRRQADRLNGLRSVTRVLYSIKANANPDILRELAARSIDFECVSRFELEHVRDALPDLPASRLLFTPNFAPRNEYAAAVAQGVLVTIDNRYVLEHWGDLFADRDIVLRVDPGEGQGHHRYVQTAGKNSKFGIPVHEVAEVAALARDRGARVVGLHSHKGSGIVNADAWTRTAHTLAAAARAIGKVDVLNLGGGLGVPDYAGARALDVAELDAALHGARDDGVDFRLWLEPGRYVVAQCGVLLTRVTQRKRKDGIDYLGVNAGMNSLLRPALYGAWHEIVNLSRRDEPATELVDIVGPICESADVLGSARHLPPSQEGDVLLIANAGAYGRVMSSRYNLRPPGDERLI